MSIQTDILKKIDLECQTHSAEWVAVTKFRPVATLQELYNTGKKVFGENKAQEILDKYPQLPSDIEWHFIGHLQSNKVKSIIDKVCLIHSVDSINLLNTIQKEASKVDKKISVLIQVHVAEEETKYGFSIEEAFHFFENLNSFEYPNIEFDGLMAMASFTDNREQVKREFLSVKSLYDKINLTQNPPLKTLSMGMSGDYDIALECGANLLRIGSILYK
jgi:PLP dependent protein